MTQPTLPDTFIPKLKKGQLVEVVMGCNGLRSITAAELQHWHSERKRLNDWFDSAGESRLPPRWAEDDFSPGKKLTVVRAAASTQHIFFGVKYGKYCKVLCTQTGHEYYVNKKYLRPV